MHWTRPKRLSDPRRPNPSRRPLPPGIEAQARTRMSHPRTRIHRRRAPRAGMAEPRTLRSRLFDALVPYLLGLAVALPIAATAWFLLRGPDVHWRTPWALTTLLSVPLGAWVAFHLERRRTGTMSFSRTTELRRQAQGIFGHLLHLPRALRLVAVALVALALARPQRLITDPTEVEGIDIIIALDVSNSMSEADLLPNRLTAAKRVIDDFIRRRPNDRIGLVLFGTEAALQCPLTLDHRALRVLLADVRL